MSDPHQNITGHLRSTRRIVADELGQRQRGIEGPGSVDELAQLDRMLWEEQLRQRNSGGHAQFRHPIAEHIRDWPAGHSLTIAVQAVVDHAWLPIEFAPGGRFSFPARPLARDFEP